MKAITMASAGQSYAPGLDADHYVNMQDGVPTQLGLGTDPVTDAANRGSNQRVHRFYGDPGSTDPQFLNNTQPADMNQVNVYSGGETSVATGNLPRYSWKKYHDVDTTYLNAVKKDKGGC